MIHEGSSIGYSSPLVRIYLYLETEPNPLGVAWVGRLCPYSLPLEGASFCAQMWAWFAGVWVNFSLIYNKFEKLSLFDNNLAGKGIKVDTIAKDPHPQGWGYTNKARLRGLTQKTEFFIPELGVT